MNHLEGIIAQLVEINGLSEEHFCQLLGIQPSEEGIGHVSGEPSC